MNNSNTSKLVLCMSIKMIKRLRIKLVSLIMIVSSSFILIMQISTYLASKDNLEKTCMNNLYSVINYTYSSKAYLPETITSPVAVVTVDYSGNITLLLNQLTILDNDELIDLAHEVLKGNSRTGELDNNIRFLRRSIGISDIRIAFADITVETSILNNQRNNYIYIWFVSTMITFCLSILFSKWISYPIMKTMNSQKQFIANASHELKTPLTVILSNANMIKSSELIHDKNNQNRLSNIIAESEQMKFLIEDMLQIARFDSTVLPSIQESTDLSLICTKSILIYEPYAFDKGFTIQSEIEKNLFVHGNATKLKQMIEILLDNALKYSYPNSTIYFTLKENQRRHGLICVKNNGDSISKYDAQKIFQRFYRIDKSRSQTNGYGLGLSIAQMIANEHNAQICVNSNENNNIEFQIRIPLISS